MSEDVDIFTSFLKRHSFLPNFVLTTGYLMQVVLLTDWKGAIEKVCLGVRFES